MLHLKSVIPLPLTCSGQWWLIEMSREVSQTSTWVTSNIVISTPYPSKQHKESGGTGGRVIEQQASFPAICQR